MQQLTAQNDDLGATVETLKQELITSHAESQRTSNDLDALRSRVFEESNQESVLREQELRETQTELERCRMSRDEWERIAMQERAIAEDANSTVESLNRDLELEREVRQRQTMELDNEREKSENLQSVLQDFQAGICNELFVPVSPSLTLIFVAKDHELRQAVKDSDSQLTQITQLLAEFKHRALNAEVRSVF